MEDRRILIDTSVVIDHFRKKNKEKTLLYELSKTNTLFLSAISKFEFFFADSCLASINNYKITRYIFRLDIFHNVKKQSGGHSDF